MRVHLDPEMSSLQVWLECSGRPGIQPYALWQTSGVEEVISQKLLYTGMALLNGRADDS